MKVLFSVKVRDRVWTFGLGRVFEPAAPAGYRCSRGAGIVIRTLNRGPWGILAIRGRRVATYPVMQ